MVTLSGVLVVTEGVTSVANLTQAGGKQEFVIVTSTGSSSPAGPSSFGSVDVSAIDNAHDGCEEVHATQESRGPDLVLVLELKHDNCVRNFLLDQMYLTRLHSLSAEVPSPPCFVFVCCFCLFFGVCVFVGAGTLAVSMVLRRCSAPCGRHCRSDWSGGVGRSEENEPTAQRAVARAVTTSKQLRTGRPTVV